MAVDTATHISGLNTALPAGSDNRKEADNNFRHIKTVLTTDLGTIGGPIVATHTELSYVSGVTSAIQTQLDAKGAKAGQTWTGAHDYTGATLSIAPATSGSQPYTKTQVDSLVITATSPAWIPTTTATSKTLTAYEACAVTASGQTISLPASPTSGVTFCRVRTRAGVTTTIGRNGNKIQGISEDMTVPYGNVTVTLGYQDSTDGWILL